MSDIPKPNVDGQCDDRISLTPIFLVGSLLTLVWIGYWTVELLP